MSLWLQLHLVTIVPVLLLGPVVLLRPKGNGAHVLMGRIWAILMVISCLTTFGLQYKGHFSWLHGLALFTIYSMGEAVYAIRKGNLPKHKRAMIGSYVGALIAFGWAISEEGRLMNTWLMSLFK